MTSADRKRGILFVLSAPSGTGKSTLARRLLREVPDLEFSVSYTTRARRPDEVDGRDYHFVEDARFQTMAAEGAFLESALVYGKRYGTGQEATERVVSRGRDLLMDIDVQGARQVRQRGVEAVHIFVLPPDYAALEARLRSRNSEGGADLARRLELAVREAEEYRSYDYLVINDELERAVADLRSVVVAERRRMARRMEEGLRVLATFPHPG